MSTQNDLSLVVPVFEAANLQAFRKKHLHRPAVVMPPHVTIPSPFKFYNELNQNSKDHLKSILAAISQFAFWLRVTDRFNDSGVLYLKPEPVDAFERLHQHICDAFLSGYSKSTTYHLTLAGWHTKQKLDEIELEFWNTYGTMLPLQATAKEMWVYEQVSGNWQHRDSFTLHVDDV